MIDAKFLKKVIDDTSMTVYKYKDYWFDVCYESSIMDSYIEAFIPEREDGIKVYFYECATKPTDIFKKGFFDSAVELFNARLK